MDPKTKFLSLTHADDTGLRESRRRIRSESRPSATKPRKLLVLVAAVIAMITSSTASAAPPTATLLLSGLEGGSGSTVGPGGALYVTESAAGRISRVDPRTGEITTFASGLPQSIVGIGGAIDVAFIGGTAYALVTLVGPDVGGSDIVGIYRIDGPDSFTVVADIGAFALSNPPGTPFDVPTGVQYALETYRGEFLVTDGHHNRVYRVTRAGEVSELIAFGNIVPTGLETRATRSTWPRRALSPTSPRTARWCRSSRSHPAPRHRGGLRCPTPRRRRVRPRSRSLRPLAGRVSVGGPAGAPALPNTGSLVKVNGDGTFRTRRRRPRPADLGRIHQEHRLRGHARRGDLEGRESLGPAARRVALRHQDSEAARGTGVSIARSRRPPRPLARCRPLGSPGGSA